MLEREFLAQRVYDMTHVDLELSGKTKLEIWRAIANTTDEELYEFYHRLVKENER